MKILGLTDIHGSYELAEKIICHENADVVVIGGDLTNAGTVKEVEKVIRKFQQLTKHLFCISGNMDLPQHDELYEQLGCSINGHGRGIGDIGFFGVSGGPFSPLHTPYEISEKEIALRIYRGFEDVKKYPIKIFVSHAPPYGTKVDVVYSGIHVGSTSVREFIEQHQPDVVICGHIHEACGRDQIGKTTIVNCSSVQKGNYSLFSIQEEISIEIKQIPKL